ncbi:RNA polymerase sigma factor [Phenylobacterium sp.]|uniref:RNA polymerase sigma factor n=1 Tax=Phenylobacterium sp. TaxID=1871053 RepID=UPI002C9AA961|nr:sigma-70 family RNA polymerase sigma factor [Phenylobacterium sp.]HLZ77234.1 sigma-70 family RNA polymerase sigma factor [Phenylobacterium sp.]
MSGRATATADREAFLERLSAHYRQPLIAYFQRRVGSRDEAEDLTQEVFLRLVRRLDVETIDNPEAFVFRTAINLLRDRSRRGKTSTSHLAELTQHQPALEDISPERVLDSRQSLETVLRALDELDERTRDVFILHRLEGMKHAELAALYGVSVSSIEKYIMKALAHVAMRAGPP